MNRKSIAEGVFRNPAIQKLLKEGDMPLSQINKLIVEEVMSEDELQEMAAGHDTKNINKLIKRLMSDTNKDAMNDHEVLANIENILDGVAEMNPEIWKMAFKRGAMPEEKGGFSEEKKKAIAARAKTTKNQTLATLRKEVAANGPICKDDKCNSKAVDKIHQFVANQFPEDLFLVFQMFGFITVPSLH